MFTMLTGQDLPYDEAQHKIILDDKFQWVDEEQSLRSKLGETMKMGAKKKLLS